MSMLFQQACESLCDIRAKVLDSHLKVSEFKLSSHFYMHFQSDSPGESMKPLTPQVTD